MGNRRWQPEEIKKIEQKFQIAPDYSLVKLIPGRTSCAISSKRRRLGMKYEQEWLNEQLKIDRISPYAFC